MVPELNKLRIKTMSPDLLKALDIILYLIHILLIGFNVLGWIWKKTRKWHLLCIFLTALSWFVLGIWYGFGYCFLTDWQWDIKQELGETRLPSSFIDHFLNQVMGFSIDPQLIDHVTGITFILAAVLTIFLNFRDFKTKRKKG